MDVSGWTTGSSGFPAFGCGVVFYGPFVTAGPEGVSSAELSCGPDSFFFLEVLDDADEELLLDDESDSLPSVGTRVAAISTVGRDGKVVRGIEALGL